MAEAYDQRFGLDDAHLRAIGELNYRNAKANPNAQTRTWDISSDSFSDDDRVNPVVVGRLRRNDVTHITDGAVGLVLASDRWLAAHSDAQAESPRSPAGDTPPSVSTSPSKLDGSVSGR